MTRATDGISHLTFTELEALLAYVFVANGVSAANAAILAANCAGCERDGAHSHGLFRMPGYVASLRSGWVDGHATAKIEESAPSFLRIDARNGFAQPALSIAMPLLLEIVDTTGVCVVAIRDSHHFSALWPDLEPLADRGLVALTSVAGHACVVPPGGTVPVFGTNPFAFATPVAGAPPMVFDFATSAMSNGDTRIAAREGRSVPPGSGIDRDGLPTTDPNAILDGGALLPFGGHKGLAMSLMVELLASALTGGSFSSEVDYGNHVGAETPRTGQLLIAIDPARGATRAYAERARTLIDAVRRSGATRLPSDRRYEFRGRSRRVGIPIPAVQLDRIAKLAIRSLRGGLGSVDC